MNEKQRRGLKGLKSQRLQHSKADPVLRKTESLMAEIMRAVNTPYKKGILRMRAFQGAFRINPDYAYPFGWAKMKENPQRMKQSL